MNKRIQKKKKMQTIQRIISSRKPGEAIIILDNIAIKIPDYICGITQKTTYSLVMPGYLEEYDFSIHGGHSCTITKTKNNIDNRVGYYHEREFC